MDEEAAVRTEASVEDEENFYVLSRGRILDFVIRLSLPVVARRGRPIHRVLLHGTGFELRVEGAEPSIGFYITYFVAASTIRDAEAQAVKRLRERWEAFYDDAEGTLVIDVDEIEECQDRFLRRSRSGIAFYRAR